MDDADENKEANNLKNEKTQKKLDDNDEEKEKKGTRKIKTKLTNYLCYSSSALRTSFLSKVKFLFKNYENYNKICGL